MKFKKVTIIGVGLIGGSIGLAIKKKKLAIHIEPPSVLQIKAL